ncbi:SRPBCC domain-containing protein [Neolewinella persica]|uniref:SRPBCC domain-containing protein n=1 Tax=Neolewinella persica TaxID=70998 RepID=UPI000363CAA7|nr:SRPBCC domain-containing protein [Neolewinella persica]
MLQLKTTIKLPVLPARVWAVLTDFSTYPEWNPFITLASGDWKAGNTVAITAGGMSFQPRVLKFSPGKELRWKGKLFFNGLFDGEHYFLFIDNGDGTTTLEHGERFSGLLVPAFRKKLETETKAGFIAMNEALRDRILQLNASSLAG